MPSSLVCVAAIVIAELIAFDLLQKSLDYAEHKVAYIVSAILLMGVVVSLAFREALRNGDNMGLVNLYWIAASSLGAIALGYLAFGQSMRRKDFLAVAFIIAAAVVLAT